MYNVSADFLTAVQGDRELDYLGTIGTLDMKNELIFQSITINRLNQNGTDIIGNAVPVTSTIVLSGIASSYDFTNKEVLFSLGLKIGNDYEYVPFAPMYVEEAVYAQDKKTWTLTCYDALFKAAKTKINEVKFTYPCTYKQYITAVLNAANITLGTQTFLNDSVQLTSSPNFSGNETLRDVIAAFAAAILCNAYMERGTENVLHFKSIINSDISYSIGSKYSQSTIGSKYGVVNSLVLARQPQEDNIFMRNEESVTTDKLTELQIINNPFIDYGNGEDTRGNTLASLYNAIIGEIPFFELQGYTLAWRGNWALEVYDNISFIGTDGVTYTSRYVGDVLTYNGGVSVTTTFTVLEQEKINYSKALTAKDIIKDTYLRVDKVEGNITAIAQRTSAIEDSTEQIDTQVQTIWNALDGVTNEFKVSGGNNMLRNTALYFGSDNHYDYWLDENGENGKIKRINHLNAVSGTAMSLQKGAVKQSISLGNGNYAMSFKYICLNTLATAIVSYNGRTISLDSTVLNRAITVATTGNISVASLTFEITCDTDNAFIIYDLMCNVGTANMAWAQNANEVRTDTVNISKGIEVTSNTTNTRTRIDSDGLRVLPLNGTTEVMRATDVGIEADEIRAIDNAEIAGLLFVKNGTEIWISGVL